MGKPERIRIRGRNVKCSHCGHDTFRTRDTLLNTPGMELLDLGWMNRTARNFICADCGHIEWFLVDEDDEEFETAESLECLSCHATIPAGKKACPACGWTYEETPQDAS